MGRNILLAIVIAMLIFLPAAYSADVEIKEFVNDYANIIDENGRQQLNTILKELYDSGTAQYSIVTIKSLEGKAIESYSLDIAQGKLGDSEKNNGLLLLVALDDRQYRFEVGRGLEANLNDAKVGRIGRNFMVPNFREGNYSKGIVEASLAVKSILMNENQSEYYISDNQEVNPLEVAGVVWFIIFLLMIIGLIALVIYVKSNKKKKNKYFDAATGAIILFGGRGSGGNSGGFGGFGGGGFGGGGASGGW